MNQTPCNCGTKASYNIVLACSGASDVGGISDGAARQISREKTASMSCIAAMGAGVSDIISKVQCANKILVIDGCDKKCAKIIMEDAGISDFRYLMLEDMGMKKGESPISAERISLAAQKGTQELAG